MWVVTPGHTLIIIGTTEELAEAISNVGSIWILIHKTTAKNWLPSLFKKRVIVCVMCWIWCECSHSNWKLQNQSDIIASAAMLDLSRRNLCLILLLSSINFPSWSVQNDNYTPVENVGGNESVGAFKLKTSQPKWHYSFCCHAGS